jgi:nitrous oxidase accessory protein NosD
MRYANIHRLLLSLGVLGMTLFLSSCGSRTDVVWVDTGCMVVVHPEESIQAAIDEAPDGAVICLQRGTWDESLRVDRAVTLRGEGPDLTVVQGGVFGQPLLWVTDGSAVVEGISFLNSGGATAANLPPSAGLAVTGTATVHALRCRFSSSFPTGVFVAEEAVVHIEDSRLSDNTQYGLMMMDSATVDVTGCRVLSNKDGGIWVSGTAEISIQDTQIARNRGPGLWIRDQGHVTLVGSTVDRSQGAGVLLQGEAHATIRTSTLSSNQDPGVRVFDGATLRVFDSLLRANWHGLDLAGRGETTVDGCTLIDNRWDGIRIGGPGSVEITECRIEKSLRGIAITGTASVRVEGNVLERCSTIALYAGSGRAEGENNVFAENGIDLLGNISGSIRSTLREALLDELTFPSPEYSTLQRAVDALRPGGLLRLQAGEHVAGVAIDKELRIQGDGEVTLSAKTAEAPVLSLVGEASLELSGVRLIHGSEGVAVAAEARVSLLDCVIEQNETGLGFWNDSRAEIVRTRIVGNEQVGVWVWDGSMVSLTDCELAQNPRGAIGVGSQGRLNLTASRIEQNGSTSREAWGGVLLMDRAEAKITESLFLANNPYGLTTYGAPCIGRAGRFLGSVSGRDNSFVQNRARDVCPDDLMSQLIGDSLSPLE